MPKDNSKDWHSQHKSNVSLRVINFRVNETNKRLQKTIIRAKKWLSSL